MSEESSEPSPQPPSVVNVNQPDTSETFWVRHTLMELAGKADKILDLLAGKADKADVDHLSHRIEEVHASASRRLEPLEEWKHASDATDRQRETFWTKRNALVITMCTVMLCLVGLAAVLVPTFA